MKKASRVTNEDLAMMVAKGFEYQDKKISDFYQEFTDFKTYAEKRFELIDETFLKVRQDIWGLDSRFITRSEFGNFLEKNELN